MSSFRLSSSVCHRKQEDRSLMWGTHIIIASKPFQNHPFREVRTAASLQIINYISVTSIYGGFNSQ